MPDTMTETSTHSYLDGAIRVVETAQPGQGRSALELWLYDASRDGWDVRTVRSEDGRLGPAEQREWTDPATAGAVPQHHLPKVTGDFDFLTGTWLVHNRRLRERLTGCSDWDEFDNTFTARTHLNGLVSIDEGALPQPSAYRGMTFRTFDVAAGEWSLHWFDSRALQMDTAPVRGRFHGNIGDFVAEDTHAGIPILCRFRWTVLSPTAATWEQAFSTDGGSGWETNWTNTQERQS